MGQGRILNICSKLAQYFNTWLNDVCQICYQDNINQIGICDDCLAVLPWHPRSCLGCANLLITDSYLCVHCLTQQPESARYLDQIRCLFQFKPPVRTWIHQLKYHRQLHVSKRLGTLLAQQFGRHICTTQIDLILPVPLTTKRLGYRGYNQSLEIAKILSKQLNIPYHSKTLIKIQDTQSQSTLGQTERKTNIKSSYFLTTIPLQNKRILLIDDVMTTGSTLQSIAKLLKTQGVLHIEAWVICRS